MMKRRNFIKAGALFVPAIFIPRLIRAQEIEDPFFLGDETAPAAGGGGCTTVKDQVTGTTVSSTSDSAIYFASRFTAASSYTSCKIALYCKRTGTLDGTYNVRLYSHNSGSNQPQTLLATSANNPTVGTTAGFVDFTSLSASLVSGTIYWVAAFHSAGGDFSGITLDYYEGTVASGRLMLSADATTWTEVNTGVGLVNTIYT
jgi:hypothetical protein